MRAPTLRQVESDLARIAKVAPALVEEARWAWPMAWTRLQRGEQLGRPAGDVARPIEAAVGTEGAPEWVVRTEVARAGLLIARAVEVLDAAADCLARAHAMASAPAPAPAKPERR